MSAVLASSVKDREAREALCKAVEALLVAKAACDAAGWGGYVVRLGLREALDQVNHVIVEVR